MHVGCGPHDDDDRTCRRDDQYDSGEQSRAPGPYGTRATRNVRTCSGVPRAHVQLLHAGDANAQCCTHGDGPTHDRNDAGCCAAVSPADAGQTTDRRCVPCQLLHSCVAEHDDHADQPDTAQFTGHACALHGCDVAGLLAAVQSSSWPSEHVTDRDCTPPPHVLEHDDQVPASQCGHTCVLHAWVCVSTGHEVPPYAAGVMTNRDCVCEPPPHLAEHTVQADHADTAQLIGQACVLQDCC